MSTFETPDLCGEYPNRSSPFDGKPARRASAELPSPCFLPPVFHRISSRGTKDQREEGYESLSEEWIRRQKRRGKKSNRSEWLEEITDSAVLWDWRRSIRVEQRGVHRKGSRSSRGAAMRQKADAMGCYRAQICLGFNPSLGPNRKKHIN